MIILEIDAHLVPKADRSLNLHCFKLFHSTVTVPHRIPRLVNGLALVNSVDLLNM